MCDKTTGAAKQISGPSVGRNPRRTSWALFDSVSDATFVAVTEVLVPSFELAGPVTISKHPRNLAS